jgi:hypothetical protein
MEIIKILKNEYSVYISCEGECQDH